MKTIVAIDGPAGSGKGVIAKRLSKLLNFVYIDTGATYRCVAVAVLENNLDINDKESIIKLTKSLDIKFIDGKAYLNNIDVSEKIRSKEVNEIVSTVSSIVEVRNILVNLQRKMAEGNNVIMEGRDITTVVFPNANYKFYIDASVDIRAERRYREFISKGIDITYDKVLENIKFRDNNDINKPVGSLTRTDDQIYIDTSNMSLDEIVKKIINIIGE